MKTSYWHSSGVHGLFSELITKFCMGTMLWNCFQTFLLRSSSTSLAQQLATGGTDMKRKGVGDERGRERGGGRGGERDRETGREVNEKL